MRLRRATRRAVPRHERRRLHPLAIAAIVILATVAVTYYAFHKAVPFVHHFTLHATVADSVNVRGGDPVRIAGIDVGKVAAVTPDGNDTSIELSLSSAALPVHRDATIRIRDRLFLEGSYYLDLDPGTPGTPVLADGGTIPLGQTSSPVQFWKLLSLFDRPTRQALAGSLEALDQGFGGGGAQALKAAVPQFEPLESDTAQVSRALGGTGAGDVRRLLRSSAAVSGTLAQSSAQLADLVGGLNATAGALAASDGALAQSVSGLDQTIRALPPALSALDQAMPPLSNLARALEPSLVRAPPILDALTTTVAELGAALSPSQRGPLIASLRATFEELPAVLTKVASSFPIGKVVTDCLATHVLPILTARVPDGSLSSGESVLADFMHFLPGLGGASGSFDGDGLYTRFLAGGGPNTLSGTLGGQPVFSTGPPGGGTLQGARPQWVGDLVPADFRPDQPCASQKVPSLASPTAAVDLHPVRTR